MSNIIASFFLFVQGMRKLGFKRINVIGKTARGSALFGGTPGYPAKRR
jgi:hypothetical protein